MAKDWDRYLYLNILHQVFIISKYAAKKYTNMYTNKGFQFVCIFCVKTRNERIEPPAVCVISGQNQGNSL